MIRLVLMKGFRELIGFWIFPDGSLDAYPVENKNIFSVSDRRGNGVHREEELHSQRPTSR